MLFNEPKLLKTWVVSSSSSRGKNFSALQRAEIAENENHILAVALRVDFSALQRAEIAENLMIDYIASIPPAISVLFNEPKLLKTNQRPDRAPRLAISVLFNEPKLLKTYASIYVYDSLEDFSALQRAEIAENFRRPREHRAAAISVLFNEPKLLKTVEIAFRRATRQHFSALQRAEIAENFSERS